MEDIKYYYNIEQGTEEWFKSRLGVVTASNLNLLITPTGKVAKGEKVNMYALELAAQRETKFIEEGYQSFDMMRGHYQEEIARDIYSSTLEQVEECGFITRDFNGVLFGGSPDGLVGEDGGIEIKSRLSKFQVKTIISNDVPTEYMNQIQGLLLVSGRKWWDFVQYSNGMPLYIKRVVADKERQDLIIDVVSKLEILIKGYQKAYKENSSSLIKTERVDFTNDDIITISEA